MIHGKVPETAEHEPIISLVLICVDDAPATDLFDGQAKKGLGFAVQERPGQILGCPGEVDPSPGEVMIDVATLFTSSSAVVEFYERS